MSNNSLAVRVEDNKVLVFATVELAMEASRLKPIGRWHTYIPVLVLLPQKPDAPPVESHPAYTNEAIYYIRDGLMVETREDLGKVGEIGIREIRNVTCKTASWESLHDMPDEYDELPSK